MENTNLLAAMGQVATRKFRKLVFGFRVGSNPYRDMVGGGGFSRSVDIMLIPPPP